jgi:hypothetical protein
LGGCKNNKIVPHHELAEDEGLGDNKIKRGTGLNYLNKY